jgi:hypothetical protein
MSEEILAVGPILPAKLGDAVRTALFGHDSGPLVEQLTSVLGTTVSGVIVYGSMARQSRSSQIAHSDVDLLVFVQEAACGGILGVAGDLQIDSHIHSRQAALSDRPAEWALYYSGARVLFDLEPPELERWLNSLAAWQREHPDPWTRADHLRSHVWVRRMIERIVRLATTDPTVAALHEARLLATLPTLHAQLHRRHTTSIGQWWLTLSQENKALCDAVASYLSERSFPPNGAALQRLVDALYRSAAADQ